MTIVVLKLPVVKRKTEGRPRQCRYCEGETFQRWGRVKKAVKDLRVRNVKVYRYRCCGCKRTFRHYPEGSSRADQTERLRLFAVLLWKLGLSHRASSLILSGLQVRLSHMTIWRDVQAQAQRIKKHNGFVDFLRFLATMRIKRCLMAEIGLVDFAGCALAIARRVMPVYRSKYSKHTFTQPQLLAILCLMRYEDWTFRETEVRLQEHIELRKALGLKQTPDYTTFYRFMRRLDPELIQSALQETALQTIKDGSTKRAVFAVDATGLAPGAISTFFINRKRDRGEGLPWRYWLKWVVVVETKHQLLLAQIAKRGPYNDCALLRPLVDIAHQVMPASLVLADAEFDSERNHKHIREIHHMKSIIPAKRGKKTWHLKGIRAQMKSNFPTKKYSQRNLVETVFSVVKRKLSTRAPGRSLATQAMQALILGLAYNLYKL